MAYKLLLAVSLVFFISHASYAEVQKGISVEEIQKQLSEIFDKAVKALGIPESDKLYQDVKKTYGTFSTTFAEYAKKFEGDAKPLIEQAQAVAQKAAKTFEESVKQIQTADTKSSLLKLQEDIASGVKKLTEQGSEAVKSLTASSALPESAKTAIYDFLKKAQELYIETSKKKA